jgi:hypothetical protein
LRVLALGFHISAFQADGVYLSMTLARADDYSQHQRNQRRGIRKVRREYCLCHKAIANPAVSAIGINSGSAVAVPEFK